MHTGRGRRRIRALWTVLWLACAAPVAGAAGEYRTVESESLKITFDAEWAGRTAPGYVPVRFDITNLGEARVIEIAAEGTRFFRTHRPPGGLGGINLVQEIRLARGDRVRLTLPVPVMADNENLRFVIREDGRTLEGFNHYGFQSKVPANDASVLIVADPGSPFGAAAGGWPRSFIGRAGGATTIITGPLASGTATSSAVVTSGAWAGGRGALLDFVLEPARLPTNWLGYTSLRAVVIGAQEWLALTEPQRSALLTWTAAGGDLVVADGTMNTIVPPVQGSPAAAATLPVRAYFFGRVHVPTTAAIAGSGGITGILADTAKVHDANWSLPANRTADWGSIAARGFRLPIPDVAGVPARTYLSILILFAVVVGPVNYWMLWRQRRQILLVVTAPLISAIFILLLAGYVVAGEGFGVRGRAATFTMLDQVRNRAATRATVSLYAAGMTPGGGLRFPRDVAVFPVGTDGGGSRDQHRMDFSESQRFAAGVIHARSPTNLEQIVVRTARERLTFSAEPGGIRVVNGLGVGVAGVAYRTGNRVYTATAPVAPGGAAMLTTAGGPVAEMVPRDLPLSGRIAHLFANQPEGSYLAIVDRSPFWEPGVPRVEERGSFHLVIGWPGGQP